jgi:hypothetical protein
MMRDKSVQAFWTLYAVLHRVGLVLIAAAFAEDRVLGAAAAVRQALDAGRGGVGPAQESA